MSGGSSGGGSSTTTQELPAWAQPYAQQILEQGAALSQQDIPQYGGQTVAGLSDLQNQYLSALGGLGTGSNTGAASSYLQNLFANGSNVGVDTNNPYANQTTSVGTNPYIGQNPYLAQQVSNAQQQTADAYKTGTASQTMAQFRNAGAFGGSAQQQYTDQQNQQLGNQLGQIATNMYGQDYANTQQLAQQGINNQLSASLADASRNAQYTLGGQQLAQQGNQYNMQNMLSALGQAGSLDTSNLANLQAILQGGTLQQTQGQNELNAQYQQWYNNAMQPYQQLGILQNALSGAMGAGAQGVTTTTQQQGSGSTMGNIFGGITSGLGLLGMFL